MDYLLHRTSIPKIFKFGTSALKKVYKTFIINLEIPCLLYLKVFGKTIIHCETNLDF